MTAVLAKSASPTFDRILAATAPPSDSFQDSDGLIAFVNLSSSMVNSAQLQTGRAVCDGISNFFATMRQNVFTYLQKNPSAVLAGDTPPTTQWDASVTHMIQYMLTEAGGLTNFSVTTESYSNTQVIADFSVSFLQLLFDTMTGMPSGIISAVSSFVQGIGSSLRTSWNDQSKNYATTLLGQCHEAVQVTGDDPNNLVYFPKIKYFYIAVTASMTEFSTNCASVQKVTFNFQYEQYVTALAAAMLDTTSTTYTKFMTFLSKAQGVNYQNANNLLNQMLPNATSAPNTSGGAAMLLRADEANVFGVNFADYPKITHNASRATDARSRPIQGVLNSARASA